MVLRSSSVEVNLPSVSGEIRRDGDVGIQRSSGGLDSSEIKVLVGIMSIVHQHNNHLLGISADRRPGDGVHLAGLPGGVTSRRSDRDGISSKCISKKE